MRTFRGVLTRVDACPTGFVMDHATAASQGPEPGLCTLYVSTVHGTPEASASSGKGRECFQRHLPDMRRPRTRSSRWERSRRIWLHSAGVSPAHSPSRVPPGAGHMVEAVTSRAPRRTVRRGRFERTGSESVLGVPRSGQLKICQSRRFPLPPRPILR